jgi:glycosyltransferase involved in cell wall biosynthesis
MKLLICETHPVQYRAPVYAALQRLVPDQFLVLYASDFSVRGYEDKAFETSVAWDVPLLSGYPFKVLGNLRGRGIDHWSGLGGRGVSEVFEVSSPKAVLLCSFQYLYCWRVMLEAAVRRTRLWIRMETQDRAFSRSKTKGVMRHFIYRILYSSVAHAFYIGEENRAHLLRHGVNPRNLSAARYCTPNRIGRLPLDEKEARRSRLRSELGVLPGQILVAYSGKMISKKDPLLLLECAKRLGTQSERAICILYVGSGPLDAELKETAEALRRSTGIRTLFVGFVNQTAIGDYYLASDILVLPSRRMGETWGLVVNEALEAGCGVVVSDAVGCRSDFGHLERFRVIPVGDADALASSIAELGRMPRDFLWCQDFMEGYSVESAAKAIAVEVDRLEAVDTACTPSSQGNPDR